MTLSHLRFSSLLLIASGLLLTNAQRTQAAAIFDFESNAPNTATPFTDTVGGLAASFGGSASVCSSFGLFRSLTGNVLIQNFCGPATESGPLSISFSKSLSRISLDFATSATVDTMTLQAFENGASVGSQQFSSTIPPGFISGEGVANFSGMFNQLTLLSGSPLAIDNVDASVAPEPSMLGFVVIGLGALTGFARGRKSKYR